MSQSVNIENWMQDPNRIDRYLNIENVLYLRKNFGRDGEISSIDILSLTKDSADIVLQHLEKCSSATGIPLRIEKIVAGVLHLKNHPIVKSLELI